MDAFQQLRKHILDHQVQIIKRELTDEQTIQQENAIRDEATRLLVEYIPNSSYKAIYQSEIVAPNGNFTANVNLIARMKVELAKYSNIFKQQLTPQINLGRSDQLLAASQQSNVLNVSDQNQQAVSISQGSKGMEELPAKCFSEQLKNKLLDAKNDNQQQQIQNIQQNISQIARQEAQKDDDLQLLEEQINAQETEINRLKAQLNQHISRLQILNADVVQRQKQSHSNEQVIKQLKEIQLFLQCKIQLVEDIEQIQCSQGRRLEVLDILRQGRNRQVEQLQGDAGSPQFQGLSNANVSSIDQSQLAQDIRRYQESGAAQQSLGQRRGSMAHSRQSSHGKAHSCIQKSYCQPRPTQTEDDLERLLNEDVQRGHAVQFRQQQESIQRLSQSGQPRQKAPQRPAQHAAAGAARPAKAAAVQNAPAEAVATQHDISLLDEYRPGRPGLFPQPASSEDLSGRAPANLNCSPIGPEEGSQAASQVASMHNSAAALSQTKNTQGKVDLDEYRRKAERRAREAQRREMAQQQSTMTSRQMLLKKRDERIQLFKKQLEIRQQTGTVKQNRLVVHEEKPVDEAEQRRRDYEERLARNAKAMENLKFAKTMHAARPSDVFQRDQEARKVNTPPGRPYDDISSIAPQGGTSAQHPAEGNDEALNGLDKILDEIDRDLFG